MFADTPGKLGATTMFAAPPNDTTLLTLTGDVNGDGNLDLVTGGSSAFTTSLGRGDGTFSDEFQATPAYFENRPPFAALVDLDHDGHLDLLWSRQVLFTGASQAYMAALGNGDGTFRVTYSQSVPGSFYGAIMIPPADFNGDGYVDFAAHYGSAFSVGTFIDVYLYNPASAGTFTASYRYVYPSDASPFNSSAIANTLTRGDFDNDGIVDLLAVATKNGTNPYRINLFKGRGDGTFDDPIVQPIFQINADPNLNTPLWTDSGDINRDGQLDFVLASSYGNQSVFLEMAMAVFNRPSNTPMVSRSVARVVFS